MDQNKIVDKKDCMRLAVIFPLRYLTIYEEWQWMLSFAEKPITVKQLSDSLRVKVASGIL